MTEERWSQRINVEPGIVAAHAAATRARKGALERFDRMKRSRPVLRWPAVAMAGALIVLLWISAAIIPKPPAPAVPNVQPAKLQFVLSDGTKVQWVVQ